MLDNRYVAIPELGLGLSDRERELTLGWRLAEQASSGFAFELGVEGSRHEYTAVDADTEGGVEHGMVAGAGWRLVTQSAESFELRIEAARIEVPSTAWA